MRNLPNLLTTLRICLIPVIVAAFYSQSLLGRWVAVSVFCIACITDFLDGFMARKFSSKTSLGQFLDPIADKLLIASTLLLLAGFGHLQSLDLIPAIVILCREIMISGLREFIGGMKFYMPVITLAKWKTTLQMLAIGFLLLGDNLVGEINSHLIGSVLLWVAGILTIFTGAQYVYYVYRRLPLIDTL